jgi:hypothetical protein
MNENQTSKSKCHTNNTPFRRNQKQKAKEKKQSKRKKNFKPKNKNLEEQ